MLRSTCCCRRCGGSRSFRPLVSDFNPCPAPHAAHSPHNPSPPVSCVAPTQVYGKNARFTHWLGPPGGSAAAGGRGSIPRGGAAAGPPLLRAPAAVDRPQAADEVTWGRAPPPPRARPASRPRLAHEYPPFPRALALLPHLSPSSPRVFGRRGRLSDSRLCTRKGVSHIVGLHAADLIQAPPPPPLPLPRLCTAPAPPHRPAPPPRPCPERRHELISPPPGHRQECANAIEHGINLRQLSMTVHTHPTLCEVLDEAFKGGMGRTAH